MSERPSPTFYAGAAIAVAAFALLPALWSFFSAVWSAATTGQVLVVSVGRTETTRELVPWLSGWARFVGPALLVCALLVWVASSSNQPRALWWLSAALALGGLVLLAFSRWFVSLQGAAALLAIFAYVGLAAYVDRKVGRLAVTVLLFGTVAVLLYMYGRA